MKKERNLKFRLKDNEGKKYELEVDVPSGSETADYLREIQEDHGLMQSVWEWLYDGWEVNESVSVSPLMIAATFEKEAHGYRSEGRDVKNYDKEHRFYAREHAGLLQNLASHIAFLEAKRIKNIQV